MQLSVSWYIVYVGVMLLAPSVLQALGVSLSTPLLRSLHAYYASDKAPATTKTKPGKKDMKLTADAQKMNQLYQIELNKEYILIAPHYERLEICVLGLVTFGVMVLLHAALLAFTGSSPIGAAGLTFAAAMCMGLAIFSLLKMELLDETVSRLDKQWLLGIGSVVAIAMWLSLTFGPRSLLNMDLAAVAKDMSTMMNAPLKKRLEQLRGDKPMDPLPPIVVSAHAIPLLLSLVAGLELSVLLVPAMRYGRALYTMIQPHSGAKQLARYSGLQVALAKAGLLLQMGALVLWVPPLVDVLPIEPGWLECLRPGMLVLVGLHHLLVLRSFIQGQLYKGLIDWYLLTHDGNRNPHKPLLIAAKLEIVWSERAKAAVEMLIPTLLLLPMGAVVLLSSSLVGRFGIAREDSITPVFFCKFFGAWTMAVWCLLTTTTVAFYRLGFVSS